MKRVQITVMTRSATLVNDKVMEKHVFDAPGWKMFCEMEKVSWSMPRKLTKEQKAQVMDALQAAWVSGSTSTRAECLQNSTNDHGVIYIRPLNRFIEWKEGGDELVLSVSEDLPRKGSHYGWRM